jgi:hypothetical protein
MTKEERITVIEKAIELIEKDKRVFMCDAIFDASGIKAVTGKNNFAKALIFFPEFNKYKPEYPLIKDHVTSVWFPIDEAGKQSRLTILNALLTEIKNKPND